MDDRRLQRLVETELAKKEISEDAQAELAMEQVRAEVRLEEYKRRNMIAGIFVAGAGVHSLVVLSSVWKLSGGFFVFVLCFLYSLKFFRRMSDSRDEYDQKIPAVSVRKYK